MRCLRLLERRQQQLLSSVFVPTVRSPTFIQSRTAHACHTRTASTRSGAKTNILHRRIAPSKRGTNSFVSSTAVFSSAHDNHNLLNHNNKNDHSTGYKSCHKSYVNPLANYRFYSVTTATRTSNNSDSSTTPNDINPRPTDALDLSSTGNDTAEETTNSKVNTDSSNSFGDVSTITDDAERNRLEALSKEWEDGENENDDDDNDDEVLEKSEYDDNGSMQDAGTDLLKKMQGMQDTSHHRSTNIGVPARPEDPIVTDGKTVHVMFCYSKYEVMEGTRFEDVVGQFHLPLTYDAIKKEALEFYQEDDNAEYFSLEYFNEQRQWVPLTQDCYDVLLHYHEQQILYQDVKQTMLFIRLPFMFDTSDYPTEEDQYGNEMNQFNNLADAAMGKNKDGSAPKPPPTLQDKILSILETLQEKKFVRCPKSPSPYDLNADITKYQLIVPRSEYEDYELYPNQSEEYEEILISTRQYILNLCTKDYDLRDILLLNVNALSHITRCIHYDVYWDFPLPQPITDTIPINDSNIASLNEYGEDYNYDDFDHTNPYGGDDDQDNHSGHNHDHNHHHEHTASCRH